MNGPNNDSFILFLCHDHWYLMWPQLLLQSRCATNLSHQYGGGQPLATIGCVSFADQIAFGVGDVTCYL